MSELPANIPAEAIGVLQSFLDAAQRHDEPAMRACVTRRTLESGQMDASSMPDGVSVVMGDPTLEGEQVVIPIRALPGGAPADAPPVMELACLVVQEDGQWKFDLAGSVDRMMGGLEAAMGQIGSAMSEAMEGIGKAMADGLSQAFGESASEAPEVSEEERLWDDAPLTPGADEFLPLAELTPLPKTQAAISTAVGSPVLVEAAVADLLRQLGSDQRQGLIDWFEDQLFAAWGDLFSRAGQVVPLTGRLRAFRIEAASRSDDRLLALDGSDLVYRVFLNHTDGYYSDAEVAAILPGVLAGLSETIDASLAGHRLLPTDEERPALDLYRQRALPRFMRRIRQLLGRRVTLRAEWEWVSDYLDIGRQLSLWGLNRVYGGLALACQDPSLHQALSRDLTSVRLAMGSDVAEGFARYEGGTLEVSLRPYGGTKPGCYEHEIAQALTAEPIG